MNREPLYRGSVKEVQGPFEVPGAGECVCFRFTDAYSVFDWGKMPDALDGKGEALALMSAWFFEKLESAQEWKAFSKTDEAMALRKHVSQIPNRSGSLGSQLNEVGEKLQASGLRTHYVGLEDAAGKLHSFETLKQGTNKLIVRRVHVKRPEERAVLGKPVLDYSEQASLPRPRLIPLEVVFRFATPKGSSFLDRLRNHPGFLDLVPLPRTLNAEGLKEGSRVEFPILELFTKLESTDRWLSFPEAMGLSGLSADAFQNMLLRTYWVAGFLKWKFREAGLELLDGKLEWALDENGSILLVDAIGPDELRLEAGGVALSKEFLRAYYRRSPWYEATLRAKDQAKGLAQVSAQGADWKRLVQTQPEPLPASLKQTASDIYKAILDRVTKRSDAALDDLIERLKAHGDFESSPVHRKGNAVLVLGSGAREHALAWKLSLSPQVSKVIVAPGNDGMKLASDSVAFERWALSYSPQTFAAECERIAKRAKEERVGLVVVGPDQYLADGWVDALERAGLKAFGPTREASKLEWSKAFSKDLMKTAGIPTPEHRVFEKASDAKKFLMDSPKERAWVVKADGLALGKGVEVCATVAQAIEACERLAGMAGSLIVEECVKGEELSWMAFCDGERVALLEPARDFKTLNENQKGPNTGGMGAYSPVPRYSSPKWEERVTREVFKPLIAEFKKRGLRYRGLIYAGLMIDAKSDRLWVLEFNARFGDPEAQVLLPRMDIDLYYWMDAVASGGLNALPAKVPFKKEAAVYVVGAAEGYPEKPKAGAEIAFEDPKSLKASDRPKFFFAAVERNGERYVVKGGRVLGALGTGKDLKSARSTAYAALSEVRFSGMQSRKDIADEA